MKGEEMNTELEQAQEMLDEHLERKAEMDVQRRMHELLAEKITAAHRVVCALPCPSDLALFVAATHALDVFLYDVWQKRINAYDTLTAQLESAVALLRAAEEAPKRPTVAEIEREVEEGAAERLEADDSTTGECPTCFGSGGVPSTLGFIDAPCPECNGTGDAKPDPQSAPEAPKTLKGWEALRAMVDDGVTVEPCKAGPQLRIEKGVMLTWHNGRCKWEPTRATHAGLFLLEGWRIVPPEEGE